LEVIDSKTEEDRKKVPPFGASIEMAGTLQDLDYKRGFLAVAIPSRPSMYGFPMDINKFSAWASKDWREALGGAVRLTGSLESRAIPVSENREEDRVTIVLKTIEVFNDDLPPRKR
jgi:hypothetical protein